MKRFQKERKKKQWSSRTPLPRVPQYCVIRTVGTCIIWMSCSILFDDWRSQKTELFCAQLSLITFFTLESLILGVFY